MKIWITRPCIRTLITRGITNCSLWLEKPYWDNTPWGERELPIFQHMPIGWVCDWMGERTFSYEHRIRKLLNFDQSLVLYLWEEICLDVDGCIAGDFPEVYTRWHNMMWAKDARNSDTEHDHESRTFCLELDIPPEQWWKIAANNSEDELREAKRLQDWHNNDIPF